MKLNRTPNIPQQITEWYAMRVLYDWQPVYEDGQIVYRVVGCGKGESERRGGMEKESF